MEVAFTEMYPLFTDPVTSAEHALATSGLSSAPHTATQWWG